MKFRLPSIHKLSPIFTVIVFGFAVWVIYHELHDHPISQIMADIGKIDPTSVLLALALVIPGLSALACYDLVAARYLKLGIGWVKPFFTGLLGYTITNSTGHQVIVGGDQRVLLLSRLRVGQERARGGPFDAELDHLRHDRIPPGGSGSAYPKVAALFPFSRRIPASGLAASIRPGSDAPPRAGAAGVAPADPAARCVSLPRATHREGPPTRAGGPGEAGRSPLASSGC